MEENKEKTVKKRQECDPAYQWHIQDLYTSDEAWEKDYESLTIDGFALVQPAVLSPLSCI